MENLKSKIIYSVLTLIVSTACIIFLATANMDLPIMILIVVVSLAACVLIFRSDSNTHITHD